jgi:hypothetical protein
MIWKDEGLRGFYKGLVPALLLTSHGAIQVSVHYPLINFGQIHHQCHSLPSMK